MNIQDVTPVAELDGGGYFGSERSEMKTFYYLGPNENNKSRVSWKMWRIHRQGRKITAWWGPAIIVNRRVTKANTLQSTSWSFPTEAAAKANEKRRIHEKIRGGYKQKTVVRRSK